MKTNILNLMAAALLCTGLAACSGNNAENNPLNVEAPAWQQFAHPKGDNVIIYKQANADAPVLQIASEPVEGDYGDMQVLWSDEKAPRGWYVNNYDVNSYDALPILGEEGEFYKVYVSHEWLGGEEGYVKKADCDAVSPVALTPELIDSIGKSEFRSDCIVKEGELRNLCFSSYLGEYDEMSFKMGQWCGHCIAYPETKSVSLNITMGNAPVSFAKGEGEGDEGYVLNGGEDQLCQPNPEGPSVFDTQKLSEEQIRQMYNDLKVDGATVKEVLYYIPEVNKERFVHIYIFPTGNESKGEEQVSASAETQVNDDDPETVARQFLDCAMARDMNGMAELMTGSSGNIDSYKRLYVTAFSEVKSYKITKCEVNGDRARVRYTVQFKYDTERDKLDLVRTADGWKVNANK